MGTPEDFDGGKGAVSLSSMCWLISRIVFQE